MGGWNRKARSAGAQRDATGLNTFEFWILQATLSIYSGWISVATIANVTLVITVACDGAERWHGARLVLRHASGGRCACGAHAVHARRLPVRWRRVVGALCD